MIIFKMPDCRPAIVVANYNREKSLSRLLSMLNLAHYSMNDVPLVISIYGGGSDAVKKSAEAFKWNHG